MEPHQPHDHQSQENPRKLPELTPSPPVSRPRIPAKAIIVSLVILLTASLATIVYLITQPNDEPAPAASNSNQTKPASEDESNEDEDITTQVRQAIESPKPLQGFSYEGWSKYPEDEETLYLGAEYRPPEGQTLIFGDATFSFPSHWRYVSGIDMVGIASRSRTLGEPYDRANPYAVMNFGGWWPVDNTNGFEDSVISILNNITFPGREVDDNYTHKLLEIGLNSHGEMVAIIEFSHQIIGADSEPSSYRGIKMVVDNVRPTHPSLSKGGVTLTSSQSRVAANIYGNAKEILSVIQCTGDNINDTHLKECLGILKSYSDNFN